MYIVILNMSEKDVLKSEEIKKLISTISDSEIIEKESAIAWDGKNLVIRLPKEIAAYLKINKENRFEILKIAISKELFRNVEVGGFIINQRFCGNFRIGIG